MYLSNVSINNFRNFDALEMDFAPGLNVITGENNIGKSNLFDAIRIALGGASNQGEFIRVSKDDLSKDQFGNTLGTSFQVSLIFSGLDEDERGELMDILELDTENPSLSKASVHFQWSWSEELNRGSYRRWGGTRKNNDNMPDDVLHSIQITLLKALRDALSGLQPGRNSQLGRLLRVLAKKDQKESLVAIVKEANSKLEENDLIKTVTKTIQRSLTSASGDVFSQRATISTSPAEFDRISNNLRIALQRDKQVVEEKPLLEELWFNGLGYNNLLFIATVFSELEASKEASLALLLVEEPEAHLHPQLQTLLADYISTGHQSEDGKQVVQTFVTTHSPTIAAHVDPNALIVLHRTPSGKVKSTSIRSCDLTSKERKQLQRMLDVTKASMLFSRGVILVEGISEAILLPVLAKREGIQIQNSGISIIPICGVDFDTFGKLFSTERIALKLSIITDGDPKLIQVVGSVELADKVELVLDNEQQDMSNLDGEDEDEVTDPKWVTTSPFQEGGEYKSCKRTRTLKEKFEHNDCVAVFHSKVTFEFDLADAGPKNVDQMCEAWHECFKGTPRTFSRKLVKEAGEDHNERVLAAWRGICVAKPKAGKPEFSQELSMRLDEMTKEGKFEVSLEEFKTPDYIRAALLHVTT